MSEKQAASMSVEDKLSLITEKVTHLEGELKGVKGQQGLIRKQIGLGRPGEAPKEVKQALSEPVASQTEPQQAPKAHSTYSWMKGCPGCGGADNTDYKAPPTHWCNKCGVPLGRVEKPEELQAISKCWNCQASGKIAHPSAPVEVVFK